MTNVEAAIQIMVALDACEERRYEDASRILKGLPIVILRTRDAGVHFGNLEFIANTQHGCYRVVLSNSKRLWSWAGANTLNEVALRGPNEESKVSEPLPAALIPQVIEVLPCTIEAQNKLGSLTW